MPRWLWITILLVSLVLAAKLALKSSGQYQVTERIPGTGLDVPTAVARHDILQPGDSELLSRYPDHVEFVATVLESFGHNARQIEATDGLNGLRLLNELGDAGVCLYEERPAEFHRLSQVSGADPDAAKLIGAWRRFFDPSQSEHEAATRLASELSKLSTRARRLAEQTPEALPFLLTDARRTSELLERFGAEALEPLAFVDLSDGGLSLRRAMAVLDRHGTLAIEATEQLGPAGLLLMERFGPLIDAVHGEFGLPRSLAVAASAFEDLDELIKRYRTRTIADALLHLHNRGLLDVAVGTPNGLRLVVEFGHDGEHVLEIAGPQVTDLIYTLYAEGRCRNAVVQAIAQGGLPAAVAAEKHGQSQEFQRIVARDGTAAILAVASACSAEEARQFLAAKTSRTWTESLALTALRLAGDSGDKTVRMIGRDGLDRVEGLASSGLQVYQFLPLYDLSHLGAIVSQGYVPTRGEFVWAGVDGALVAVDVLSLMSLQPEGVAASEAARGGIKSTARATVKSGTQAVAEKMSQTVASQAARTTTRQLVRNSGEQLVEHMAGLGSRAAEGAGAELAESLSRRSGIRLVRWHSQYGGRLILNNIVQLPRNRLAKYVVANGAQAGIGLVAVRKMEEYLEGRGVSNKDHMGSSL